MTDEEFITRYQQEHPIIFAYLLMKCANWHLAEDLTGTVFQVAWEKRNQWQDVGIPYSHYLMRIARFEFILHWKKQKRWRKLIPMQPYLSQHLEAIEALESDGGISAVLDRVNNAMAYAMLNAALQKMRPRPLKALALRYGAGLTEIEASRVMGCSFEAYRATRRGAIERLQQILIGKEPRWTEKNAKRRASSIAPDA